jgi:archaellum component FlaC
VGRLEARKKEVEALLAAPSELTGGHRELQELAEELGRLDTRLEALLTRWEELEAKR